jgi:class 3 adenylate cyclase
MQRKLAAIVHADVVGYSRLMEGNETITLRRLKSLRRELWDPVIAAHNGRLVGTAGDALLLEFPSAVNAVKCAVALQKGMQERNAGEPDNRKMLLRIGVNLGEVIVDEDNDIFGDGVNMAARLQAMADPGGIIVSAKVHDEVEGRVPSVFVDGGEHQVKNIARPVRIFRIAADAAPQPVKQEQPPHKPEKSAELSIKSTHSVTTIEPLPPPVVPASPAKPAAAPARAADQGEAKTDPGGPPSPRPVRTITRTRTTIRRRVDHGWTFSGKDRDGVAFEIVVLEMDLKHAAEGLVVGRHTEQCQIVIAHGSLSRKHARLLFLSEGGLSIEDLGSTNGTIVDGMRLPANQPRPLRHGAQIVMGEIRFVLSDRDADTHG